MSRLGFSFFLFFFNFLCFSDCSLFFHFSSLFLFSDIFSFQKKVKRPTNQKKMEKHMVDVGLGSGKEDEDEN